METLTKSTSQSVKDAFPLNGTDYVEFYVGNAKQSAFYYQMAFGYELIAYKGPETGHPETCSYVLQQGKIRFVINTHRGKCVDRVLTLPRAGVADVHAFALEILDGLDA